jgi:hypothetical protein
MRAKKYRYSRKPLQIRPESNAVIFLLLALLDHDAIGLQRMKLARECLGWPDCSKWKLIHLCQPMTEHAKNESPLTRYQARTI